MEKNSNGDSVVMEIKKLLDERKIKEAVKLAKNWEKREKNNLLAEFWRRFAEIYDLITLYTSVPTEKLRGKLTEKIVSCINILKTLANRGDKVLLHDWETINFLIGLILDFHLSKQYALDLVDLVLEANPNHSDIVYAKTTVLIELGRIKEAIDICQNYLTRYPNDIRLMERLAAAYSILAVKAGTKEDKKYYLDEAEKLAEKVLELDPNNCGARYTVASVTAIRGNLDGALSIVEDALQVEDCTRDKYLLCLKADLLRDLGQFEEALKVYNTLLDMNNTFVEAWEGLTKLWRSVGELKKALESAKMAYLLNPQSIDTLVDYLIALRMNKKYKEVQKLSDAALRMYPGNPDILLQKALALSDMGKYNEAKKIYLKLIELNSLSHSIQLATWYGLGEVEYASGNYSKAMEYIERAQQINPNDEDALDLKAEIYMKLGDTQKAIDCYKKIYEITDYPHIKKYVLKKIRALEARSQKIS